MPGWVSKRNYEEAVRSLLLLSFLAFVELQAAFAQGIQDDPRRRRVVLPTVRAATDCIAHEALAEPDIETAARDNRLRTALGPPMKRCADEVDDMIHAHDRAYFPGAGEAFFRGPYLQDLVRAVQQRIGPELANRSAALSITQAEATRQRTGELNQKAISEKQQQDSERQTREQREVDAMWKQSWMRSSPTASTTPSNTAQQATSSQPANSQQSSGPPIGGGALVGGFFVLALLVAGIRRAAQEKARKKRYAHLLSKYGDATIVDQIMERQMWQGMTEEMLMDSWGPPVSRDSEVYKARITEVLKYGQTGRNRFKSRVKVENGVVVGYVQK